MLDSKSSVAFQGPGLPTKREYKAASVLPTKRKRDSICGLQSFCKPFAIQPHPKSAYDKPDTFRPIRLIFRSQLPLTFLDLSTNSKFASSRLFSANISILEKKEDAEDNDCGNPKVLIARHENDKCLYAIERVESRTYSLCKLVAWLKEKEVANLWDPSRRPQVLKQNVSASNEGRWWHQAAVETNMAETREEAPSKRIRLSMLRSAAETTQSTKQPLNTGSQIQRELVEGPDVVETVEPPSQALPVLLSSQQLCEKFVEQYLEALYLSKASLAYFAKGPIARARAAFTSTDEGALPTYEFVTFLRSMLLSHKAMDKKYREKLSETIKAIPPGCFSDEEFGEKTKLKKSKKKVKLNRDGLYPKEEDVIKRWWIAEMPSPEKYGEETAEQRIKRRVGDLRIRETLAQLILMLEIVALEALATYKGPSEDESPLDETQTQGDTQTKPKKRKKKLEDIQLLIDLLLDKLCIWQSVEQDDMFNFEDKPSDAKTGKDGSGDRLRNFCVEVIVPFYMGRLPEQCAMINKKLGGPVAPSPPKRKATKAPPTSRQSGDSKEPDAKKSRRSFGRTATDTTTLTAHKPLRTLNRSSTDPSLIPGFKREASEISLSAIPLKRSPSRASNRPGMSQFARMASREVDLSRPSAAAEAKLRQKKRVEEELKDAISALKKPNRGLTVGEYISDVEKRGLGVQHRSRKPANPTRRILQDVQVTATPKQIKRTRDFEQQTPSHHHTHLSRGIHYHAPPSSNFFVPSSTIKPAASKVSGILPQSPVSQMKTETSITETPSRGPGGKTSTITVGSGPSTSTKGVPLFKLPAVSVTAKQRSKVDAAVFETPSRPRYRHLDDAPVGRTPAAIFSTPVKGNRPTDPTFKTTSKDFAIFSTPQKHTATEAATVADTPAAPTSTTVSEPQEDKSIFDALGWNDDDDFL